MDAHTSEQRTTEGPLDLVQSARFPNCWSLFAPAEAGRCWDNGEPMGARVVMTFKSSYDLTGADARELAIRWAREH